MLVIQGGWFDVYLCSDISSHAATSHNNWNIMATIPIFK